MPKGEAAVGFHSTLSGESHGSVEEMQSRLLYPTLFPLQLRYAGLEGINEAVPEGKLPLHRLYHLLISFVLNRI